MRGTTRGTAGGLLVIATLAIATSLFVSWKIRDDRAHLRALLAAEIDRGSLVGLGRAQAIGRRVVVSNPDDAESAALLVYTGALLATEFGQGRVNDAEAAAALVERASGASESDASAVAIAGAARALLALRRGDFADARARATAAASAAHDGPYARCALGLVRAATGDLPGANDALAAAMIDAPGFLPAKVAWAEVQLDLGDPAAAVDVLADIVAHAPEDIRARLLLDEATLALVASGATEAKGGPRAPVDAGLAAVCNHNGASSPYLVAGCALAAASRARFEGDRFRASSQAFAAARVIPEEPRMLARAAQLLAQQGAVDRAEVLLARAAHVATIEAPALAWARLAVTLGHGRAATAPPGLRARSPLAYVLAARASFAVGGAGALAVWLDRFGAAVVARDADLRLLATLVPAGPPPKQSPAPAPPPVPASGASRPKVSPSQEYVDGLRARLGGDPLLAAEHLSHALAGHGDACRAAGEYVATLGSLNRHPDPAAFTALRAENRGCVNLPAR